MEARARSRIDPPPLQLRHVPELDGLRGLLALAVVLSHIVLWCAFAEPPVPDRFHRVYQSVIYSQWAVEVFFILSGFAISFLIHSRPASFAGFMVGRFFRLYPVYLVCLALGLATAGLTPFVLETAVWRETSYFEAIATLLGNESAAPWRHLGAHLTLLHGLLPESVLPGSAATLLVPAWSISVEWQYYLCALLIARWVRSPVGLLVLALVSWIVIRSGQDWSNPLRAFLPLVLPFFLIGIGSFHLFSAFVAAGARRSNRYIVLIAAAVAAAILARWHTLALVVWIVSFGALFVTPVGFVGRMLRGVRALLDHRWTQWLGRVSYPLYLVHWPLIIVALAVLLRLKPGMAAGEATLWLTGLALPIMLAAAWLLHRAVEAPLMRVGRRWSSALSAAPPPPAARSRQLPAMGLALGPDP